VAPEVEQLITVRNAHNIHFYGLTFEASNWTGPSSEGFFTWQADSLHSGWGSYGGGHPPAGVYVEDSSDLKFERNAFRNMGAEGLLLYGKTKNNLIVGNIFKDISASGIGVSLPYFDGAHSFSQVSENDVIKSNYFTRNALNYRSSVAIYTGDVRSITIEHNEIYDLPYTGISVGWFKGADNVESPLGNNSISYNKIHRTSQLLEDGGGIYTLSKQPGTVLKSNYIYDVPNSKYSFCCSTQGIFLDEYSSYMTLENNVLDGTGHIGIVFHWAHDNTLINNTILNTPTLYSDSGRFNNILGEGGADMAWVTANAGIEPAYQDITNLSSKTPPVPGSQQCHLLDSSKTIPAGFGAPYNVLSSGKELLLKVNCSHTSASFPVGNGSNREYIYKQGYFWNGSNWENFTLNCPDLAEGAWCIGKANYSSEISDISQTNYHVAYVCNWTISTSSANAGEWKCGCRDFLCATNYWNLQAFRK
jgi:parallel beta-helix repeat protein